MKVAIKFDKAHKMYFREDTSDSFILKEQATYKPLIELCEDKVVLDMGANIGAFSNNALRQGAKAVWAFEPEPENIEMIKRQPFYHEYNDFHLVERAVSTSNGIAHFYVNGKTNKGCHSLIERRGRQSIEVKTVAFREVVQKIKPQIIKSDIEGAELMLNFEPMLEMVEAIAIEIHFDKKGTMEKALKLRKFLRDNFNEITKPSQSKVAEDKFMRLAFFIGVRK